MRFSTAIDKYVAWKRAQGVRFNRGEGALRTLLRSAGDRPLHEVTPKQISGYLNGASMSAYTWWREYQIIRRFFRFWMARHKLSSPPMPPPRMVSVPSFRPYIFSRVEIVRLLLAIERARQVDPMTLRTFLLFLYGTGARGYEAFDLRVSDVDLANRLVSLRQPGGNRKRIIPIGRTLRNTLDLYLQLTAAKRVNSDLVFLTDDGRPLKPSSTRYNFVRLCARARIRQESHHSPTPGLHDLRHTFAVHVLETWIQDGKDLRQKLPILSGYMGHAVFRSTEIYLRLVPGRFVKPLSTLTSSRTESQIAPRRPA